MQVALRKPLPLHKLCCRHLSSSISEESRPGALQARAEPRNLPQKQFGVRACCCRPHAESTLRNTDSEVLETLCQQGPHTEGLGRGLAKLRRCYGAVQPVRARVRELSVVWSTEVPELTEEFFASAKWRMPREKVKLTVEVEPEVAQWFKAQGDNYQRFLAAALRIYAEAHRK